MSMWRKIRKDFFIVNTQVHKIPIIRVPT